MLNAQDVMTKNVIVTGPDVELSDTIRTLLENKISGMPVNDSRGDMIGIITEKDILNFVFSGNLRNSKVKDAMTKNVTSFPPDTDIDTIALAISEHHFRRVPIVESGRVVGIISRRDILRQVLKHVLAEV